MKKTKQSIIDELKKENKFLSDEIQRASKAQTAGIAKLKQQEQEIHALKNRLDAALYAMCLMRAEVAKVQIEMRNFKFSEKEGVWLAV